MKKLIIRAGLFLITLFIVASLLQRIIDKGLQKSTFDNYKEWNDMLHSKINADLLILGSSRAVCNFSPQVLDSAFNLNSYNLGIDGLQFRIQYYRLLFYLQYNKKPKYIIQDVDHFTLNMDPELYGYTQFLPYLTNHAIQEGVSLYEGLDWKDIYIPLYKYHSDLTLPYRGLMNNFINDNTDNGKYKGFRMVNKSWDLSFKEFKESNPNGWHITVVKESLSLFKKYLDLCKDENIKLIFVYPPEYIEAQKLCINRDSVTHIFRDLSAKYNIPFFDYSNDSICTDTINFYNSQHLNAIGVEKFNAKLVKDLKSIIQ